MIKFISLKKWPQDWDKHIIQTCQLYFENKPINLLEYNEFFQYDAYPNGEAIEYMQALRMEFEYVGRYYVVDLDYKKPCFSINCYYKDYDGVERVVRDINPALSISLMDIFSGYDSWGLFVITPIAGQSSFNETPYEMVKVVESIILNHNNGNDGGDDFEDEPISPPSPVEELDLNPVKQ